MRKDNSRIEVGRLIYMKDENEAVEIFIQKVMQDIDFINMPKRHVWMTEARLMKEELGSYDGFCFGAGA